MRFNAQSAKQNKRWTVNTEKAICVPMWCADGECTRGTSINCAFVRITIHRCELYQNWVHKSIEVSVRPTPVWSLNAHTRMQWRQSDNHFAVTCGKYADGQNRHTHTPRFVKWYATPAVQTSDISGQRRERDSDSRLEKVKSFARKWEIKWVNWWKFAQKSEMRNVGATEKNGRNPFWVLAISVGWFQQASRLANY